MIEDEGNGKSGVPNPEVDLAKAKKRRNLTVKYKLRILREVDALKNSGEIGALLRREGLYSSHLNAWRRERDNGHLSADAEIKRGRKAMLSEIEAENIRLKLKLAGIEVKYEQAQKLIEAQKKIAGIMECLVQDESKTKEKP